MTYKQKFILMKFLHQLPAFKFGKLGSFIRVSNSGWFSVSVGNWKFELPHYASLSPSTVGHDDDFIYYNDYDWILKQALLSRILNMWRSLH